MFECSKKIIPTTHAHSQQGIKKMNTSNERIQNLSAFFPLSPILGLMPCADDDSVNRRLTIYTIFTHTGYRILNLAVLVYFLMKTRTSASLMALLAVVTIMKFLCAAVHVIVVIKNRHRFLSLVQNCDKSDFHNVYRTIAKISLLYVLYLYTAAQIIQKRWEVVIRDVFSMLDVLVPILIILQFCTFLKIAKDKFKDSRMRLVVLFYRTDDIIDGILDEHIRNLDMLAVLQDLYSQQMLFCVSFLGFDFFVASYDTLEHVMAAKNLSQLVCTTSYCTLCLTTIMILARACEATKHKAEKFDEELFSLMNDNHVLRRNPKLKLYLKRKMPVNFTGSNFFNLGYPLVTKIVAATATYLTFLIQFSDQE